MLFKMSLHSLETKSFECHICSKVFTHAVGLNIHFRAHFNQNIYICDFCQKIFSKQCLLLEHLQSHEESKLFTCDECHKVFPHQVALNVHRQSHTKKDILCSALSTAEKGFFGDNEIENTESSFMTDKSEYDEIYSDCISSENEEPFEFNMLPNKPSKLNVLQNDKESLDCHFTPDIKKSLKHKVSENKDIFYDFSQGSADKNNLNYKKNYLCNVCKIEFFTQNGLDNHSCELEEKEKFICDICNATFSLKTILYSHRHLHKRFRCKICMKEFSNSQKYLYHINAHEKPFKCIVCEKGFAAQMHLDDHLRMHINEKPFECEECLATFSQKSHLNRHLRMHEKRRISFLRKSAW